MGVRTKPEELTCKISLYRTLNASVDAKVEILLALAIEMGLVSPLREKSRPFSDSTLRIGLTYQTQGAIHLTPLSN